MYVNISSILALALCWLAPVAPPLRGWNQLMALRSGNSVTCHFFFSLFNQYLAGIIQLLDSSWLDWSGLRGMISRSGNAAGPSSFSLSPASLSTGWIVGFFFFLMFWKRKMIQVDWFDCTRRLNWTNLATLRPEWNSSYWHLYLTSGPLFSSTILLSIWCI